MKRLLLVILLIPCSSYAQRYAHLFSARAAADSILFSLLGTQEFFSRIEPLDKMRATQIQNQHWVTIYEGIHDTVITEPYSATFGYKVYPPDRRDIFTFFWIALTGFPHRIEFTNKADFSWHFSSSVKLPPAYGQGYSVFKTPAALREEAARITAREVSKRIGKEIFDKEFTLYRVSVYPSVNDYRNSRGDSFIIAYEFGAEYLVHAINDTSIKTGVRFGINCDGWYDTTSWKDQIQNLPECLRKASPCIILSEQQAIDRTAALGLPKGKESPYYKCQFSRNGNRFVWYVLSVDTHKVHPCELWKGEMMRIDAITGDMIDRKKDGFQQDCRH